VSTGPAHNFDADAQDYERRLDRGLAVSGERSAFFARARIAWLATRLRQFGFVPETLLDYGCGTGGSSSFFVEHLGVRSIVGLDVSARSLEEARKKHPTGGIEYYLTQEYTPRANMDVVFCNGVFHHIPRADRPRVLRYMIDCARPGAVLALWENNPWNPGTRYIMSRIPFDRHAVLVSARELRSLAEAAGLSVLTTDFYFVFPGPLRNLRRFEAFLTHLPVGGQYLVLCRKGATTVSVSE
jgi:trans-aconitate methyltransferase